jgi:glycosyltransferase involved in cell wall biosynthesis
VAINLAAGFVSLGQPTDLVAGSSEGEFAGRIPPGVRLVDLKSSRVLLSLPALMGYLRRERPAAVIAFMDHAGIVALWARRLSRSPARIVCTVHNTLTQSNRNSPGLGNRVVPALLRAFYPSADAVVAVSHGAARALSETTGFPLPKIQVIYNPVITPDLTEALTRLPSHPWLGNGGPSVVLGVGRLTRQKDFASLVRAFALVRKQRPARLLILGEGEERSALQALVQTLGLQEDVALPGFVAEAHACMAKAAVFVLSSAWEGLPTVLIEALAAGTTVVSTDCPSGPREILQDGRLGALVPVGDVEALSKAIVDALERPAQAVPVDALGPFTRDAAVDHYLRLIESIR